MILCAQSIRAKGMVHPCLERTEEHGLTHGLGPAGYDVRLDLGGPWAELNERRLYPGEFVLAATLERFEMPDDVLGRVCDKSSLIRRGLFAGNTVIEPGWRGFLTLELVNHSNKALTLIQGQAIAQVIFELLDQPTDRAYCGKYQDQEAGPQEART